VNWHLTSALWLFFFAEAVKSFKTCEDTYLKLDAVRYLSVKDELGQPPMPDTKTLNEEWLHRIKLLFQRSVTEADVTKSKSLWSLARSSESIRLEWLDETRKAAQLF